MRTMQMLDQVQTQQHMLSERAIGSPAAIDIES